MDEIRHRVLRFDRFALDVTRGCLRVAGQDVVLPPKPFEVLRYLAENAGRLVPKDELCRAVWPNVFVSDDSLVQCIREVRSKLGDNDHQLIKTLHRRGYLLDAKPENAGGSQHREQDDMRGAAIPVSAMPVDQVDVRAPRNWVTDVLGHRHRRTAGLATLGFLLIAAAVWAWSIPRAPVHGGIHRMPQGTTQPSLVVLPFENLSADRDQDYFADGVTEDLITTLSRRARGMVIARSTAFTYKGKPIDVRAIGRELGVRYVLEGTVGRSGEQVRVTARLVDVATAANVWAESFSADRTDLPGLRDEVAVRLARALSVELVNVESARSMRDRVNSPDAVDLMMRAKAQFYRTPKGGDLTEVRRLFREALRLDEGLADAWLGLSRTYIRNVRFSPTREQDLQQASDAVERALALEPNNATARLARGWVRYEQGRMNQALLEFEFAAQLDPGDPLSRTSIAAAHVMLGRPELALAPLHEAMRLSPMDPELSTWQLHIGVAYLHLKRDEEALHWLRRSVALSPSDHFSHLFLASTLALSGHETEAQAATAELLRLRPGFSLTRFKTLEPSNTPEFRSQRVRVYDGLRRAGLPD